MKEETEGRKETESRNSERAQTQRLIRKAYGTFL